MKKLFVLLLLTVYGLSSTGMTLHFHYCCGKLDKIDLAPVVKKCNGMHQTKPCCDNREVSLKISSEQNLTPAFLLSHAPSEMTAPLPETDFKEPVITTKSITEVFAPPPLPQHLLHLYCIYRI